MGSKAREGAKAMSLAFVLLDIQHAGVRRRAQCTRRSVDMQQFRKVSRTRTTYSTETHTKNTQRSRCRLAKRDSTETVEWRGQRGTHKVYDAGWRNGTAGKLLSGVANGERTRVTVPAGNCRAASRRAGWQ